MVIVKERTCIQICDFSISGLLFLGEKFDGGLETRNMQFNRSFKAWTALSLLFSQSCSGQNQIPGCPVMKW